MTAEKAQLEERNAILTHDKSQLETKLSAMTGERDELQRRLSELESHDMKTIKQHAGLHKLLVVFLGLLCAFLLAVIVGLIVTMTEDRQQLQDCQISHGNLSTTAQERELQEHELHQRFTNLAKEKSQVQSRYNQLQDEKAQLEAKCSAAAEERDELQRRITRLVNVVLDPDTAHPNLMVSHDGKQVRLGDTKQNLPYYSPKRFNTVPCILGKGGISSGKFYYEVEVRQKMCWDIGVAKESINRKGQITYKTQNGYWIVMMRGNGYFAPEFHAVPLYLKQKPERVGVFVDYEAGLVSFYDADSWYHIHSYTSASFSEKLYPFLSTCAIPNQVPLIISPVKRQC
ncbi:hypothetical protein ACEWY4_025211 [Coilia grayii]|uniref:B30.2/SPRY domain-containing protein n=1 Tax=Coilia grayii TaxID=363190 RepID=A0ABD1IX75_9TELE